MKTDAQIARTVLSEMTGAPYHVTSSRPVDLSKRSKWYVTCLDGAYYSKTAYADTVWSDEQGRIWVDSTHLGSTTDWVGRAYGEKGAIKVGDFDYQNLSIDEVQMKLGDFPKVFEFIERCKTILANISLRLGIELEMLSDGKEGIAWFLFRARVNPYKEGGLARELRKAVAALKEAYDLAASEKEIIEKLSGYL